MNSAENIIHANHFSPEQAAENFNKADLIVQIGNQYCNRINFLQKPGILFQFLFPNAMNNLRHIAT